MFDHCWSCEKASLSVRILKRDVGFKYQMYNLLKSLSSRTFLLEFWEERGEKLMTCHLFLDNFSWNFMTFLFFSKVKSFETDFSSKKTQISQFDIMKCSSFLNPVFRKRRFIAENWLCFRACNSRIVTYDKEFVLWCDFVF